MARSDRENTEGRSQEFEVHVPEGLQLSEDELQQIGEDVQGDIVDIVSPERAAALKVKVIPKVEEVQPKLVPVAKVKQ